MVNDMHTRRRRRLPAVEMVDDTDTKQAANGQSSALTLGYLACCVTAMSQLPHEVNKGHSCICNVV